MPNFVIKSMLILVLAFVACRATAADALFRSGFESSICNNSESEPNDTAATGNAVALDPTTASAMVCGAVDTPGNIDFFGVAISGTSAVLIETIRADGAPCDATLPMSLKLFDAAATLVATDDNGGIGGCASLDGTTSPVLQNLPPGDYYIEMHSEFAIPVYALSIRAF